MDEIRIHQWSLMHSFAWSLRFAGHRGSARSVRLARRLAYKRMDEAMQFFPEV